MKAMPQQAENVLLKLLRSRRSLRRYRPAIPPRKLLEQVLQAAIQAPSAHNRQPWRFVVLQEYEDKAGLARTMGERLRQDLQADGVAQSLIEADVSRSYERMTAAPVLILLCLSMRDMDAYPDAQRNAAEHTMAVQGTAMAGQNLLLAAPALGLG
ncbi:MAG: nitroreductase family protein, partial [Anaerolineaceae bacterium]|nr:nitroreductase family protein [Anaerolineaceae bacterium]